MFPINKTYKTAERVLLSGGVCILPTDTVYGIHCSALNKNSVERIYEIKERDKSKPFVILIPNIRTLETFGINADKKTLSKIWPGPYSVILPCGDKNFEYLHRGKKTIAFRIPNNKNLLRLLKKTGPLVSTSVNIENEPSISSVRDARKKFGTQINCYIDEGVLLGNPSTVIDLENNIYRK